MSGHNRTNSKSSNYYHYNYGDTSIQQQKHIHTEGYRSHSVKSGRHIYFPPDPNLKSYFRENLFSGSGPLLNGPSFGGPRGGASFGVSFGASLGLSLEAFLDALPGLKYFSNPLGGFSLKCRRHCCRMLRILLCDGEFPFKR